ncbi:MAG TPA: 23S rRNA (guanosine(2251)-2'-O)-methyltransferase RlmB [Anaerolineales bacterium]|jgi:23S rRNA (guanosine2251-2'-O)-methyltransferase
MSSERLYGRNPVYEVLRAGRRSVRQLLLAQGLAPDRRIDEMVVLAEGAGAKVARVQRKSLEDLPGNHQGVALDAGAYPYVTLDEILSKVPPDEPPFFLLLDVIQDPQNLATLLRAAEAFGVHGVVMPPRRAAGVTPAVVSASSGACEHLWIAQENLAQAIEQLKQADVWITGLDAGAEARLLPQAELGGGVALVVGSEGEGLRRLVRQSCDFLVRIPMRGQVDSLNAATAGAIALYAVWQARRFPGIDAPPDS